MRNIIIIIVILLISSCGKGTFITYELINETGYGLVIEGYSHRGVDSDIILAAEKMFLEENSTISFQRAKGEVTDQRRFFSIPSIDSVRIIFDYNKLLVLSCPIRITSRNCHSIFNYSVAKITEEDYNNAVNINAD